MGDYALEKEVINFVMAAFLNKFFVKGLAETTESARRTPNACLMPAPIGNIAPAGRDMKETG